MREGKERIDTKLIFGYRYHHQRLIQVELSLFKDTETPPRIRLGPLNYDWDTETPLNQSLRLYLITTLTSLAKDKQAKCFKETKA